MRKHVLGAALSIALAGVSADAARAADTEVDVKAEIARAIEDARAAEARGDMAFARDLHSWLAMVHLERGEHAQAVATSQKLVDLDREVLVLDHLLLASAQEDTDELHAAEAKVREALRLQEGQPEHEPLGSSYRLLGRLLYAKKDYAGALRSYERALEVFTRLEDELGMAMVHGNLGALSEAQGDLGKARTQFERALELARQAGEHETAKALVERIARIGSPEPTPETPAREPVPAELAAKVAQAREEARALEAKGGIVPARAIYVDLADFDRQRGDLALEVESRRRILEIDQRLQAGDHGTLGRAQEASGALGPAETSLREAVRLQEALPVDPRSLGTALLGLGKLQLLKGDRAGARQSLERANALFASAEFKQGLAATHMGLATLSTLAGDAAESRTHLERARELAREIGDEATVQSATRALELLRERESLPKASAPA